MKLKLNALDTLGWDPRVAGALTTAAVALGFQRGEMRLYYEGGNTYRVTQGKAWVRFRVGGPEVGKQIATAEVRLLRPASSSRSDDAIKLLVPPELGGG